MSAAASRRAFIAGAAALGAAGAVAVPAVAQGDAELVALARDLMDTDAQIIRLDGSDAAEAAYDRLYERRAELMRQIEAIPSRGVAGLQAKARAVQSVYPEGLDELGDTTDMRLCAQILEHVLALAVS